MMTTIKLVKVPCGPSWGARAHIGVLAGHQDDGRGHVLLSAECVTPAEVRYWADKFIKELERIKLEASRMEWK